MKRSILSVGFIFLSTMLLYAQEATKEIKLSELFSEHSISIFDIAPKKSNPSLYDTIKVFFILTNDFDRDSIIYYTEGHCDWYSFYAAPLNNNHPVIHQLSGRQYYGKIPYDNVYYPAQKILLKAGTSYNCIVKWKSTCYIKAGTSPRLITAAAYFEHIKSVQNFYYTNRIITFLFTGAMGFGFFFFLFLYYKSRYTLFGVYTSFLFLQILYAIILLDVYTIVGSLFISHPNWDEYVTELIAFLGQAIYIQFIIGWLKIKQTSIKLARIFNMLSIFFFVYAISFFTIYTIAPGWQVLWYLKAAVRLLGLVFQLFLFYNIIFKIKTAGRLYILVGNVLFMIMAIIMIYIRGRDGFIDTWFEDIDNASWYMLGVLLESICFSLGMGLHYFELKHEKDTLYIRSLQARQLQLEAEENNLNDRLRISQDLHDNIGSTLSSISVYSQVAKIHGEKNETTDLNEMLEKIGSTSNDMVTEMNDIVWAINPVNDSLEKIIKRMESFANPLAAARKIKFDFRYDASILSEQLDMDKRKNFYLIFKEAVTNAIKYSAATDLHVDIIRRDNYFELIVKDNGIGFNINQAMNESSQSLSGNGLKNMQARAALLNGNLAMVSQPGNGTTITLHLPLR